MKTYNVLVTGIGGPTAQGILKGLERLEDVRIIGADRRRKTSGNHFCDVLYHIPPVRNEEAYKETIEEIIRKEDLHAIFPSLHEEISIYKEFRKQIPVPVALPISDYYNELQDKAQVYNLLEKKGRHAYIPDYFTFHSNEELLSISEDHFHPEEPIVVKQVDGHGALGFSILLDHENYLEALRRGESKVLRFDDYIALEQRTKRIAMEYFTGKEYSIDVFLHEGEVITAIPRLRNGVSNGLVLDGTVVKHMELIEAATVICEDLAISGFMNLQFMHDGENYKLTDINPRFCGSLVMSLGANVNFPSLFLNYEVKKQPVEVEPYWNTRMMRYRESVFFYDEEEV